MAASVATITGKVLIQIGDDAPVEVGTVEIPIYAGTERPKATRGRVTGTIHICTDADEAPTLTTTPRGRGVPISTT